MVFDRGRLLVLVLLVLLSLVSYVFWDHQKKVAEEKHLNMQKDFYSSSFRYIVETINDLTDMIFYLRINDDPVLREALKKAAAGELEKYHWLIYRRYKSIYENFMRKKHVRQLHFHLPGNISFVRMHKPEKFGDSLKGIRYSIDYVNRTKKPIKCFEEGRIFNGFRNVYPILEGNRLLGTVEISYGANAIESILKRERQLDAELWIDRRVVIQKVWKEELGNYVELPGGFLVDRETHNTRIVGEDEYRDLVSWLSERVNPEDWKRKAFYWENLAVVMLPVKNCRGDFVAYFVLFVEDNSHTFISGLYRMYFAGNLLFNAILVYLLYKLVGKYSSLREMSLKDALTGVLNRRAFYEFAKKLLAVSQRENKPVSLIMCDIDRFKSINDTHGHHVGDIVLREVAQAIQRNTRESDIVGRYGGEEFVIMVPVGREEAKAVAEKLRKKVEELRPEGIKVTCSFGVAQYRQGESLEDLLNRADMAMYRAKEKGRNRVEVL